MPRAKFRVTVPEGVWIGDLSRQYPAAEFRILAAMADDRKGVGLTEITSGELDAILEAMHDAEEIVSTERIHRDGERALVQFETTMPLLLMAVRDSGIPLEMPFTIVDGEVVWEITASHERLSELGTQLSEFGIPYTLEKLRQRIDESKLLTDRQEALLETAVERGYYDTPRECTLTELAEEVGVAKSTCSEVLHRAEGKVIKRFVTRDHQAAAPDTTV